MKSREFDPAKLDVEAFAKAGESLQGEWPLPLLSRLAESTVNVEPQASSEMVQWSMRGERRKPEAPSAQTWLHVQAETTVRLECQRCLKPVEVLLRAARSFMFVAGEAAAAELDAQSEDDVLALSRALDARELIEDELLLSMPLVPRHEVCPQPLSLPVDDLPEDETPHPFAVLAALKRGSLPN